MRRILQVAVTGMSLLSMSAAQATNVFRLEGYGPISRAMGGTAVAHDIGGAGLVTNPATLGLGEVGNRVDLGLDIIVTDIKVTNKSTGESVSSSQKDLGSAYYAPEAAFTRRVGDFTWGVGAYAGGGLGTEYGSASFLSRTPGGVNSGLENASRLLVLQIPAGFAYKVNDRLTVGGALEAVWTGMNLELLLGADQVVGLIGQSRASGSLVPVLAGIPGLQGAHFSLSRGNDLQSGIDAWGWGGRFGLTYQLASGTRLGAAYNLKTRLDDLEGRATLRAVTAGGNVPLTGQIRIVDFQMPDSFTLGVAHQATDRLLLAADVTRVRWGAVMKDIKVKFAADAGGDLAIQLPQDYRDITIVNLGGAYRIDNWTLRAGLSVADQAISGDRLFAIIPATPTQHLTLGLSYQLGKAGTLDLAYSHALRKTMDNASLPNVSPSAPISVEHAQNNLVIGYSYRF
jgi:long-chain fatty acid transport protein